MRTQTLAIDFGTSNSAAAVLEDGKVRRLSIEAGADTLPTAVFFAPKGGQMLIGEAASSALISGDEGRYMRALKSVLGTGLFHEARPIGGRRQTLADIVTAFLAEVKARAEAITGQIYDKALSGRPVQFHTADPVRDVKAEDDLRSCYLAAGFSDVAFMLEPEAAAVANHGLSKTSQIGLIVDIGGGTSDFTLFRAAGAEAKILASHGVRLGGTDFDQAISVTHAMPLLGLGGQLRRTFGAGLQPVPKAIYGDLATWAKIPFLYTGETRRAVAEMERLAVAPDQIGRLAEVLGEELGHQLAFAVEDGKIAANSDQSGVIGMGLIEPGLEAPIDGASMTAALDRFRDELSGAAAETLKLAGIGAEEVATIVLVGGSSLMNIVRSEMTTLCPNAELAFSEAFTAVVDGLALASAEAFA